MLFSLVLIFFSGIRWKTGTDWLPYEWFFTSNNSFSDFFSVPFEPLFVLLNFVIKYLANTYTLLLFAIAIITISIKVNFFLKYAYYPFFTFLCNASICALDLFTVRQGIAISVTLLATVFIIKKKPIWFCLTVVVAMGFHVTAIVFFLAYKIFHSTLSVKKIILSIMVLYVISHTINLMDVIKNIASIFSPTLFDKAVAYQELDLEAASNIPLWIRELLSFIKKFFFLILFSRLVTHKNVPCFYRCILRGFYNLFALSIFLSVLLGSLHPVFERFGMYFSLYEVLIIPLVPLMFTERSRIIVILGIFIYLFARFYYGFASHLDLFFPYETIFDVQYKEVY
ncbi:hypothetical protein OPFLODJI_01360 [Aeromonas hydrophila]